LKLPVNGFTGLVEKETEVSYIFGDEVISDGSEGEHLGIKQNFWGSSYFQIIYSTVDMGV